jgi:hypothetical protein
MFDIFLKLNHVNDWYVVNRHVDNIKRCVLTNFFEQTKFFILVCIVALWSPLMHDKVILKIVVATFVIWVVPWQ